MFHVGQIVVALATWSLRRGVQNAPFKGRIYTVRGIESYASADGTDGLHLEEIRNAPAQWRNGVAEASFHADYFRPVRPQSIEWAREIARDVKQPQRENV